MALSERSSEGLERRAVRAAEFAFIVAWARRARARVEKRARARWGGRVLVITRTFIAPDDDGRVRRAFRKLQTQPSAPVLSHPRIGVAIAPEAVARPRSTRTSGLKDISFTWSFYERRARGRARAVKGRGFFALLTGHPDPVRVAAAGAR